ncbi:MAG: DUF433 domain-containing protein [Nitrospira sp.]|nr:DUF433 domain-containing protein [Nitrospira sp.]
METLVKTEHPYIVRKSGVCGGSPVIEGTRITVRLIAQFVKTGSTAEEILASYPHLSLAQIHDAISYYFDHREEIEQDIEDNKIKNILRKYNLRLIPHTGIPGVGRIVAEKEFESLSEEEKGKAYTWETLPEEWE